MKEKLKRVPFLLDKIVSDAFDVGVLWVIARVKRAIRALSKIWKQIARKHWLAANRRNIWFVFSVLFIIWLLYAMVAYELVNSFDNETVPVDIGAHASAKQVAYQLKGKNLIRSAFAFRLLAKLSRVEGSLQAGTYRLSPSMPLAEILTRISQGRIEAIPLKIVITEGSSIQNIAKLLKKKKVAAAADFIELTHTDVALYSLDYPFLKMDPTMSLEGYLFPDTYIFPRAATKEYIAQTMLKRFEEVVLPLLAQYGTKDMDLHKLITIASIIEKEAARPEERRLIASVYYNRLKENMHLNADPTIKYVLPLPRKSLRLTDLKYDSPYNTYIYVGLPPGPICNPGKASIIAALQPAETDYLYFVSKGDGSHYFSKTHAEHLAAQQKYQTKYLKK